MVLLVGTLCTKHKVDHYCPLWAIQTNKDIYSGLIFCRVWLLMFYEILLRHICKDYANMWPSHAVTWHNAEFNFVPLSISFIMQHESFSVAGKGMLSQHQPRLKLSTNIVQEIVASHMLHGWGGENGGQGLMRG